MGTGQPITLVGQSLAYSYFSTEVDATVPLTSLSQQQRLTP